ncbi:MAG: PorP/SprF family type IX secretion system membrane protein [Bacteroidales bacterium]|nr:PorP/SprF family type IX secretion system membrane protein [Bacteroidales bacterium]
MLRRLHIVLFLVTALGVSAQNTLIPSVSNYHLTWTTINPAFSGFRDAISMSSLYRSALYGDVGPQDMQLNVHSPVGNSKVALGGVVAYNKAPPDQNLYSIMTTYAYRIYLGTGRLSFGISAGMYGVNSDNTGILLRDPDDPSFPEEIYQRWFPNFGAGVLYYTDQLFFGVSVPELLAIPGPDQSLSANPEDYRVIMTGAYLFDISRAFKLKPSVILDYSRASTTFKASLNVGLIDSRVYIGGAYDHPNYAIALLNFQINPQWLVGYAYTIGTGPVRTALGGSHEVVLRWELRPVIQTIPDDPFYF